MKLVSFENLSKYNELLNQKTVRSVNSVKPDSTGNVQLGTEKSTFNKVVYDTGYFSIEASSTYSFDLTGSDLENVSKENVNIRLVAKVVTAHNGFEVGDIAQLSPGLDISPDWRELDVCAYIRGNTLYIYSGNYYGISIVTDTGKSLSKTKVQIKAVLTAFIPDDGSILLIAEDQNNTSKLIGLPDGTLTWGDKNIVRSVNGVGADAEGNVIYSDITESNKGVSYIKFIDGTLIQWAAGVTPNTEVNFGVPFLNASNISIVGTVFGDAFPFVCNLNQLTKTYFRFNVFDSRTGDGVYKVLAFIAVGRWK